MVFKKEVKFGSYNFTCPVREQRAKKLSALMLWINSVNFLPETRCPNICSRRDRVAGAVVGGGAGAPLGGGGGGATVALDPGTGKDMLCFNSGLVGEPN